MKPEELYKRIPERIDNDVSQLHGCYYNHIPEIDELNCGEYFNNKNTRVAIHYYKDHCFDGRRVWILAAIKFDDVFVMITQNAGREGDDSSARFITNKPKYDEMINYLKTLLLLPKEDVSSDVVYEEDSDISSLTTFYGNTLDGDFETY